MAAANADAIDDATGDTELGEVVANQTGGQTKGGRGTVDRSSDDPVCLQPADGERWQDVVIETFRRRSNDSRVDWGRRSRRMQPNSPAYIPARRKINGLAIALVVDVSGSCSSWFGLWQQLANELVEEVETSSDWKLSTIIIAIASPTLGTKAKATLNLSATKLAGRATSKHLPKLSRSTLMR